MPKAKIEVRTDASGQLLSISVEHLKEPPKPPRLPTVTPKFSITFHPRDTNGQLLKAIYETNDKMPSDADLIKMVLGEFSKVGIVTGYVNSAIIDPRIVSGGDLPYDILLISAKIDEIDYSWSSGILQTAVYKKSGSTVATITYSWNADGTIKNQVRS
jgi:hypothetical protein